MNDYQDKSLNLENDLKAFLKKIIKKYVDYDKFKSLFPKNNKEL